MGSGGLVELDCMCVLLGEGGGEIFGNISTDVREPRTVLLITIGGKSSCFGLRLGLANVMALKRSKKGKNSISDCCP